MQQPCPKTHFLGTLFQSAVNGGLVRWSVSSCHTVLGYDGGIVAVRTNTAIVIPGVSVYAHTSPATIYVAFAVTSVILILHYLFGRPALVCHKLPASTASTRTRTDGTPTILANTREGRDVRTR